MRRASAALVALALACAAQTTCTGGAAPHARAQRIQATSQLIGGPKAIGEIGDFLLENDKIRVIIHGNKPGRGNTLYGGSIIDADLVRVGGGGGGNGNDQLAEVLPALLFEVIEPTNIEVTADGSDGGPAQVTVTGKGGDLLQLAALLVAGLLFPANLDFAVTYTLTPGKSYIEIDTSVINNSSGAHPLPFLDPAALSAQLPDIPMLDQLQLSVPFGELLLFGGEQAMFAPGAPGFDVRFGIEDAYATAGGFPAFPGLVVDHVATRGNGVSYGFAAPAGPDNYVNQFADRYPGQSVTPTSFLLGFNYASVAGAYSTNPPSVIAAGETFTYTSYFIVGRGDAASVYETVLELRDAETGRFAGRVLDELTQAAPSTRVSVVVLTADGGFVTQADTDAEGAFTATLEPGDYRYHVVDDRRAPIPEGTFTVTRGATTSRLIQVPGAGHLAVFVTDETGRPAPAKASLVAEFDAAHVGDDPRDFLYSLALGEKIRPTAFEPGTRRYIEAVIYGANGRIAGDVRPGTYDVVVSRGPEYETRTERVTIAPGQTASFTVRLERAFATPGWIAADVHLHSGPSTDSGLRVEDRVLSCAAEGVDLAVSTEHNFIADYQPYISELGLDDWIASMVGIELTTFEMGHFNAYPLAVDPGSTRGGEFVWTRKPPADMFDQLRGLGRDPARTIVQVNHPREQVLGYFASFFVDADDGEPYIPSGLRAVFAPYGDEFQPEAFSYDFDAIELLTGKHFFAVHTYRAPDPLPPGPFPDPQPVPGEIVVGADGRAVFPGTVESWFTLLDRNLRPAGTGSSDSHHLLDEAGYARTYVYVGGDAETPGDFREADIVDAIRARHTVTTNAPMIEMTIDDAIIGDEVRAGPAIDVNVRVRAPSWAKAERLVLWSNSAVVAEVDIPADRSTDFAETFPLTLARDAWVVAEVFGSDNMFPVVTAKEFEPLDASVVIKALGAGLDLSGLTPTGSLKPDKTEIVRPYAITSPIWVDIDGGGWLAPRPALSRERAPQTAAVPDLRDVFAALPGGTR
jgi:hypothetical protein